MKRNPDSAPPRPDGRDRLAWLAKHAGRSGVRQIFSADPADMVAEIDRLMDEEGS